MKKIFLLFITVTLSVTYAQKSGYENLAWGSTADEVRKKYNNIERTSDSDADFKDAVVYTEKYANGSINSREFVFWKNKLVKVLVQYDIDKIDVGSLIKNFKNKFGEPIDTDNREEDAGITTAKIFDAYWNNNGTRVILRGVSIGTLETILTLYISLKYADDYNNEKLKDIEF